MNSVSFRRFTGWVLPVLPAAALGVHAMAASGVSPMLWGQQAAAFVVFALLGLLLRPARRPSVRVCCAALLAVLCAPLLFPAVGGVRRWIDLGLLSAHAAMLSLPALLLTAYALPLPHPALFLAAVVLCIQPDLSQLAALALGALPVFWQHRQRRIWSLAALALFPLLVFSCLKRPAALEPVAYCEGIVPLLGAISPLLAICGVIALTLIPCRFFYGFLREKSARQLSLALYYAVTLLFTLTGEYPVPLMGFGLSPIAGYWLAGYLDPAMPQE